MEVIVKGVKNTLTAEQIKQIEAHHAKQIIECSTFTKTLKHFGFKKMNTKNWVNPNSNAWSNDKWFAQIYESSGMTTCQIVGEGVELRQGWPL